MSKLKKLTLVVAVMGFHHGCNKGPSFAIAPESEAFGQFYVYNNKVDVLWVVDDSESMGVHQNNIARQFGSFIDTLNARGMDYRLAVTTADMGLSGEKGAFVGKTKVIEAKAPNVKELFGENIKVGTNGSALTRGLEAMKAALSPVRLNGDNAGFLRSDARLALVFISDDEDKSVGSVQSYADFLTQLKPPFQYGAPGWIANFIGVTDTSGACTTGGFGQVYVGTRFLALTELSKGESASVCSNDLSAALSRIQSRIVGMITEYHLGRDPVLDSIRVYINGTEIPKDDVNGWSYYPQDRRVRFNGSFIPPSAASVKIDYQPVTSK